MPCTITRRAEPHSAHLGLFLRHLTQYPHTPGWSGCHGENGSLTLKATYLTHAGLSNDRPESRARQSLALCMAYTCGRGPGLEGR